MLCAAEYISIGEFLVVSASKATENSDFKFGPGNFVLAIPVQAFRHCVSMEKHGTSFRLGSGTALVENR